MKFNAYPKNFAAKVKEKEMAKKKLLWGFWGIVLCLAVSLFAACATNVNAFMDSEVPVKEHAVLIVDDDLSVKYIDGSTSLKGMKAWEGYKKGTAILVTPGKHQIEVSFGRISGDYNSYTVETASFEPVTWNFTAGKIYRISASESGNSVSCAITETDTAIWDKRKLSSTPYPKTFMPPTVIKKAAAAAPTEFEGTWQTGDMEFTFTGGSFMGKVERTVTPERLNAANNNRKKQGLGPITSPANFFFQGTFEIKGTTVVFRNFGLASVFTNSSPADEDFGWSYFMKDNEISYTYSLSPEGKINLGYKKGKKLGVAGLVPVAEMEKDLVLVKNEIGKGD